MKLITIRDVDQLKQKTTALLKEWTYIIKGFIVKTAVVNSYCDQS